MSSLAVQNLEVARNIRARGYPTSIHANPTFKKWFDEGFSKGSSVYTLYRAACEKWGKENVPSPPTLYNYAEKFLPFDKLLPFIPNYKEQIRGFDAYQKMVELCQVMEERLAVAREQEKKLGIMMPSITKAFDDYAKALLNLLNAEIRLGIRGIATMPTFIGSEVNMQTAQEAQEQVADDYTNHPDYEEWMNSTPTMEELERLKLEEEGGEPVTTVELIEIWKQTTLKYTAKKTQK